MKRMLLSVVSAPSRRTAAVCMLSGEHAPLAGDQELPPRPTPPPKRPSQQLKLTHFRVTSTAYGRSYSDLELVITIIISKLEDINTIILGYISYCAYHASIHA